MKKIFKLLCCYNIICLLGGVLLTPSRAEEQPVDNREKTTEAQKPLDDEILKNLKLLKDSDGRTRIEAAFYLRSVRDKRIVPGLTGALNDKNKDVRIEAAAALRGIDPEAAFH